MYWSPRRTDRFGDNYRQTDVNKMHLKLKDSKQVIKVDLQFNMLCRNFMPLIFLEKFCSLYCSMGASYAEIGSVSIEWCAVRP